MWMFHGYTYCGYSKIVWYSERARFILFLFIKTKYGTVYIHIKFMFATEFQWQQTKKTHTFACIQIWFCAVVVGHECVCVCVFACVRLLLRLKGLWRKDVNLYWYLIEHFFLLIIFVCAYALVSVCDDCTGDSDTGCDVLYKLKP